MEVDAVSAEARGRVPALLAPTSWLHGRVHASHLHRHGAYVRACWLHPLPWPFVSSGHQPRSQRALADPGAIVCTACGTVRGVCNACMCAWPVGRRGAAPGQPDVRDDCGCRPPAYHARTTRTDGLQGSPPRTYTMCAAPQPTACGPLPSLPTSVKSQTARGGGGCSRYITANRYCPPHAASAASALHAATQG